MMNTDRRLSWLAFGLGVLLPFAVALALVPLRHRIDNANVALLLAAAVVVVASMGRRVAVIVAAFSAMAWFDFFHTRPYQSFTMDSRDDVFTAAVLLVVGVLVGELAIRGRRHRIIAEVRRDELDRIHAVAAMVAAGESSDHIVMVVATELRELLVLRDCRYEQIRDESQIAPTASLGRDGAVVMGDLLWSAETNGLPGKRVDLDVHVRGRLVGRFVMEPTPAVPIPLERRIVAVALADQVGAALAPRTMSRHV